MLIDKPLSLAALAGHLSHRRDRGRPRDRLRRVALLLFIGAGDWNTRQTNGVLMIEDEDKSDPSKVLEYLHLHFGVQDVLDFAYIVLVNKKRVAETSHV